MSFTWGELAFGTGTGWGGEEIQTFSVTGVEGTAAVGTVVLATTNVFLPSGVEATSAVGDETVVATALVEQTGLQLAAALGDDGTIADAIVLPTGVSASTSIGANWGDDSWGTSNFGGNITFRIGQVISVDRGSLQAVEATGAVGTVGMTGLANVELTGVSTTAQLGDEYAYTNFTHAATGLEATADLGASDEEVIADAVVVEEGFSATGAIGGNVVTANADVLPTGLSTTASLGDNADDEATGGALVVEEGVQALGRVSPLRVNVTGSSTIIPTGVVGTTNSPKVTMWGGGDGLPGPYDPDFWTTAAA